MATPEINLAEEHFPDVSDRGLLSDLANMRLPEIWATAYATSFGGRGPDQVSINEFVRVIIAEEERGRVVELLRKFAQLSPEQQRQVLTDIEAKVIKPMGENLVV